MADGAVKLEVLGRLLALVRRVRGQHRLTGGRVHDLLAVGIEQRLAGLHHTGRSRRATGGLRCRGRCRWLIAQRARHALRAVAGGALLGRRLLAAQRRLIRVELFGRRLDRAEIHVGGHFGFVAIIAQHRLQDVMHTLGEHAFHATAVVELFAGHGQRGVFRLVGEQVALLVDHGDLRFAQFRNTGRHQIDDGQHLTRLQRAPGIEFNQYRSAGLALVTHEHRTLRDRQVHAGALDVVQAGNGAGQFAFEAATITGRLHELAGAQPLFLVEDFKTDVAVAGSDTSAREFEPRTGQVLGLDQQGTGIGFDGIRNIGGGQGIHDLLGVHTGKAAIQRTVVRLLGPQHHGKANRHARGQADQQAHLTQHGHLGEVFQEGQPEQRRLAVYWSGLGRNVIGDCFCHDSISSLNRHLHDVLVCLNQLVTHLGQCLKGDAGFFLGDHHIGQVDTALADLERGGQLGRRLLGFVDLVDGLAEHVGEAAASQFRHGDASLGRSHGVHLHGPHVQHQPVEFNSLTHGLLSLTTRNFLTLTRRIEWC
ncbi:hypothetical protein D3C85_933660 [compost metagenome]